MLDDDVYYVAIASRAAQWFAGPFPNRDEAARIATWHKFYKSRKL